MQKANFEIKLREFTTQEEVTKSVKPDTSQRVVAIKDNDGQWAQVATKGLLTVVQEKCSPTALQVLSREAGQSPPCEMVRSQVSKPLSKLALPLGGQGNGQLGMNRLNRRHREVYLPAEIFL